MPEFGTFVGFCCGQNRVFLPFETEFCLKTTHSGIARLSMLEKVANELSNIHSCTLESAATELGSSRGEKMSKLGNNYHFRCNYG